jgi:hypothetical protein
MIMMVDTDKKSKDEQKTKPWSNQKKIVVKVLSIVIIVLAVVLVGKFVFNVDVMPTQFSDFLMRPSSTVPLASAPVLSKPGCENQGWTECGYRYCTNLAYDDNNCGKCGNVCTNGNICLEGNCGTLDGMNEMSDMTSLRLQMTMDRRSQFISTLSNIMKKIGTTQGTIIQNLK